MSLELSARLVAALAMLAAPLPASSDELSEAPTPSLSAPVPADEARPEPEAISDEELLRLTAGYGSTVVARRGAAPSTSTRLDAEDLRLRGAATVPEALDLVPGVEINEHPKSGGSLQVRGFDERGVLLLLDGIPIREAYAGHFDLSSMLAAQLGAIEVDRGVTSPLYGPNSMGGVVDLRGLEPPREGTGRLELRAGNLHGERLLDKGGAVHLGRRLGDFSLSLSGAREQSDGFALSERFENSPPTREFHEDGGLRAGSDFARSMLMGRLRWEPRTDLSLTAIAHGFWQERGVPAFEGGGYTRHWRFADYDTLLLGLVGDWTPGSRAPRLGLTSLKAAAYFARHEDVVEDYQDESYAQLTTHPLAWFVASSYLNHSAGLVLTPSLRLFRTNSLDLSAALHWDRNAQREIPVLADRVNDAWGPWDRYGALTVNLAAEDSQRFGRLRLAAGAGASGMRLLAEELRDRSYPVDTRLIGAVDGRMRADYELSEGLHLVCAGGHKTRYPTLKELFSNALGGNPDLAPERAWMAEAGLDLKAPRAGAGGSARLFYNGVQDLIDRRYDVYANVERATLAGAELAGRWRPLDFLELQASYTLLYAHDEIDDRPLDYRSPHSLGLDVRLSLPWGTELAAQGLYRSGQRSYFFDTANNDWRDDALPGYALVNAYARHRVSLGDGRAVSVNLRLRNLLDANYVRGSYAPQPGRQLYAGIGFEL